MRVGILTFHTADNYGAVLQALALSRALTELGHDTKIIDYRPASAIKAYRRFGFRSRTFLPTQIKRYRFQQFRRRILSLTQNRLLTPDSFTRNNLAFDAIIVGSDQVWNINSYRGFDPPFFLDFPEQWPVRRISYAASVGRTPSFGDHKSKIASLLQRFTKISVRDKHTQEVIEQTASVKATLVLDPVFLSNLDDIALLPTAAASGAIVGYCLKDVSLFDQNMQAAASLLNKPAIMLGNKPTRGDAVTWAGSAGPTQWLGYIKSAGFILTNSFHGLCFALKYQIPFAVQYHEGKSQQRLTDLLKLTGLQHRVIRDSTELEQLINDEPSIDFGPVNIRLEQEVSASMVFLRGALT